jgi:Type II secretion system (T2SS), protein E, N-terminal domain
MKVVQRLEYTRLAEALTDRGLVNATTCQQILAQCTKSGELFTELLVHTNLVADWELARIVSETFALPFVPVDIYEPAKDVAKDLDQEFLCRHCLVPLDRIGDRLSVSMPGMVSADVLGALGTLAKATVVPLVGSVAANRAWLHAAYGPPVIEEGQPGFDMTMGAGGGGAQHPDDPSTGDGDWLTLFDNADQQVKEQNQKRKDAA